jgi:hypothetical protein
MSKEKRVRTNYDAADGTTRAKGDVVEEIAAKMHQTPGVEVQRNVFLPAKDGSGRKREIDVLLSRRVAGYPVFIAIECKNQKAPIEVGDISEFYGKLEDVGIPVQHGIYISRSRYRSGARLHAKSLGIQTFLLREVTLDSLEESVWQAFQSLIYLLMTLKKIEVTNTVAQAENEWQMLIFCDENGQPVAAIPDLVWQQWVIGELPDDIGSHRISIEIPNDWRQIVDGEEVRVEDVEIEIEVTAHVIVIPGTVSSHMLVNTDNKKPERWQVDTEFEIPSDKYSVKRFTSEKELQGLIHQKENSINLSVGRFRLPRIRFGAIYWPPSERVAKELIERMRAFAEGKIPDPRPFDLNEVEGTDMSELWAPIWHNYPFIRKDSD